MKLSEDYTPILLRILDSINNIESLLETTTEQSFTNELKDYNAICLELIQIGEKVNQLPERVYEAYPNIPWHELYGLRNRIVHGYDKVKKSIIWATIVEDIPTIKKELEAIVK